MQAGLELSKGAAVKQELVDSVTLAFPSSEGGATLRDEQTSYHEVLESMEQGIIVWSADGYCEMVNARYYKLLNQGKDYLYIGMHRSDYFRNMVECGDIQAEIATRLEADLLKRQPFNIERKIPGGLEIAVYIRPLPSGGHVVTYTDITASKNNQMMLSQTIERAEKAERKARESLKQQQERQVETSALADLSDWLQCCKSIDELYEIVHQAMAGMFPASSGQLYIYSNSRDVLDGAVTWGSMELTRSIQPQDCWGLRRGRTFQYGDGVVRFACNHFTEESQHNDIDHYLCLPIIAQGDTVGMLHICFHKDENLPQDKSPITSVTSEFAKRCAEQISIAIANVKLRDELHEQSTRDPLTGLFNRRYFHERCRSVISLLDKQHGSVSLISIDADNFKSYNDHYGHDAGDFLLCTLSDLLLRHFTNDEVCCRTGGEEFSILLPNMTVVDAEKKAADLIQTIETHDFRYLNQQLPTVTVSAGVAAYPADADSLQSLCRVADLAMYEAKDNGKNRVCLASELKEK